MRIWEGPILSSFFQVKKCLFLHLFYRAFLLWWCFVWPRRTSNSFFQSQPPKHTCAPGSIRTLKNKTNVQKNYVVLLFVYGYFASMYIIDHAYSWCLLGVRSGCWLPWTGLQMVSVSHHVGGRNQIWTLCKGSQSSQPLSRLSSPSYCILIRPTLPSFAFPL